ncbi:unnamed protein product [Lepidochelys kempii]
MYAKRLKSDLVELCRQRGLRIGRSTKEQLIAQLEERDRLDDPIPVPEGSCPGDAAWALGPDRAGRGQTAAEDIPRPFLPMSGGGVGGSPANTEGTLTPAPSRGSSRRSSPSLERRRLEWEREMKMRELEDHEKQRQHEQEEKEKQRQHERQEKEKQRQHEQEEKERERQEKERERQEKERERQEKERERQEKEKQRQHELELARLRSSGAPAAAAVSVGGPKTARNFDKCFLAQRKEGEDMDSFLTAFENACELHRVDPADRLQFLTPLLDPKAVEVYSRMTGPEAGDYELFKQALLREFGLTVKAEKCKVGMAEVSYLGHRVGSGRLKPEPDKVEVIRDWPAPHTKKQVQAFIGMAGYYRRFVPHFSAIATPITELCKKGKPDKVVWTEQCQEAFRALKEALVSGPVLANPDFDKPFVVFTDASDTGLGAVLMQEDEKGERHPIVYLSKKLLPREQHYAAIEKECLAMVWALKKLEPYLFGRHFTVYTDHSPLTWLHQMKGANAKLLRWSLLLQDYDMDVVHVKGSANLIADALSRRGGPELPQVTGQRDPAQFSLEGGRDVTM